MKAFFGLLLIPLLAASNASGADDKQYPKEYRAYSTALEAGDTEAAVECGLAAMLPMLP